MVSNYFTLRCLADSLDQELKGSIISSLYTQQKDEMVVAFEGERPALLFSCKPEAATCYLHPHTARARRNSTNLLAGAVGATLTGVSILPGDRVLLFTLSAGDRLVARLFSARSNVLLVDSGGIVIDAFKRQREEKGTTFAPTAREQLVDVDMFRGLVESGGTSALAQLLKKAFPVLGATLTREVFVRAGVDPSLAAADAQEDALTRIQASLLSILRDIDAPSPIVYLDEGGAPALFSILPLRSAAGLTARPFDDIHAALRFFLSRRRAAVGLIDRKAAVLGVLRQQIEKDRRTREAIMEQGREGERADEYEQIGSLLLANLGALRKGMRSVELGEGAEKLTATLDEKLTPVQNAQRYFDKARRSRVALAQATERASGLAARIRRAEALLEALQQLETQEEVDRVMAEHVEELDEFGLGEKGKAREQIPFRIFVVDGGFEVWAGKSSENNDLLTLRYARPNDLWFHARGAGGSHVILKVGSGKGEPGKKAKAQAAGIAAYYSKMKNAGMVPVAMTEKKYVRKPKGAPSGTVVLEREKVIFAQPELPEQRHE